MNAMGAVVMALISVLVIVLPHVWAALGVMAALCYLTQTQTVDLLGFNFTAIRIVLLAGMVRLQVRGELKKIELNLLDKTVITYAAGVTFVYTLRLGTTAAFVYQIGCSYDILLSYFVFRGLIASHRDLEPFLRRLAILIVPFALSMMVEFATGRNIFDTIYGGLGLSGQREGRFRAQGAFRHAITGGMFGASLLPLFGGLLRASRNRFAPAVGLGAAGTIIVTSNSSGPLMALYTGVVALSFWPLRGRMRAVRWGIVATLLSLQLVMKAPVWYIFSKISSITGGHGWHRSQVIDQAIGHFRDWYILGTDDVARWDLGTGGDAVWADITNEYVSAAVYGGLAGVTLLVVILVRCFQSLGAAMQALRERSGMEIEDSTEKLLWSVTAVLVVHVVSFFEVSYFDQVRVVWWLLPGMIGSITASVLRDEGESAGLGSVSRAASGENSAVLMPIWRC